MTPNGMAEKFEGVKSSFDTAKQPGDTLQRMPTNTKREIGDLASNGVRTVFKSVDKKESPDEIEFKAIAGMKTAFEIQKALGDFQKKYPDNESSYLYPNAVIQLEDIQKVLKAFQTIGISSKYLQNTIGADIQGSRGRDYMSAIRYDGFAAQRVAETFAKNDPNHLIWLAFAANTGNGLAAKEVAQHPNLPPDLVNFYMGLAKANGVRI